MPDVGQVSILDSRSGEQTGRVTLGGRTLFGASGLTLSKDGTRLYVTQGNGGLVTVDTATDTVIGVEPGPNPTAADTDRTGSIPAVLLAGTRVGIGWATFPNDGPLKAAGLSVLTMPAR
jgi:DNA-binding beta-propeller fold protein YncE